MKDTGTTPTNSADPIHEELKVMIDEQLWSQT